MNKVHEEKWDKRISFYIIFYFIISSLNSVIKLTIPIAESSWSTVSVIGGILIISVMLYSVKQVYRRSKKTIILSILFFSVIYISSILLSVIRNEPIDLILKGTAFLTFAWWIPIGIYAYSVFNKKILYEALLYGSYIISLILSFPFLFFLLGIIPGYNMFFSYALILPLILHINEFFQTKRKGLLIISIIEFIALILFGARGPLLSLVFYFIIKLILIKPFKKKFSAFCAVFFLILFGMLILPIATEIFSRKLETKEIQSRTLTKFVAGSESMLDVTNRFEIWNISLNMISERPILGWGLGGEYYTLGKRFGDNRIDNTSTPHNGIIQLWLNFGLFFGSIFLLIIVLPFLNISKIKDLYLNHLLVIFFAIGCFPRFFISSGFFIAPEVAIYFYLFLNYRKMKRVKKVQRISSLVQ